MNYFLNILFSCVLVSTCMLQGIVIVQPSAKESQKAYRTISQLKTFFKKHGMKYLENNVFGYTPVLHQDMKKESYYLEHQDVADFLTKKYTENVRKHHRAPIELRWVSATVGYGVFAYKAIKKGDFIAEYTGEVVLKESVSDTDYCWAYPPCSNDGKPLSCDSKYKGNEMRYVNHSYNPNVMMKYILVDNIWHVCYLATEDIPAGKQLLVNYGDSYWNTRSVPCQTL